MRIVVVGTTGAGKTTLASRIAVMLELPHIELDAINWQSGWRDLTRHDPEEFSRTTTPCGITIVGRANKEQSALSRLQVSFNKL